MKNITTAIRGALMLAGCDGADGIPYVYDPAKQAVEFPNLLVTECLVGGMVSRYDGDRKKACSYIYVHKWGGDDCVKMAETGLQGNMDGIAAARCTFKHGRRNVKEYKAIRLNVPRIRACLNDAEVCEIVEEVRELDPDRACKTYAEFVRFNDPKDKPEVEQSSLFIQTESKEECRLMLTDATNGVNR